MISDLFKNQKPVPFQFPAFWGVLNRVDPTKQPEGALAYAKNLRFDKETPRLRPGFNEWAHLTDRTLDGIATWKIPAGADQPETRHLVAFGTVIRNGEYVPVVLKNTGLADAGPEAFEEATYSGDLVGAGMDVFSVQYNDRLYFTNGINGLAYYSGFGFNGFDVNILVPVDPATEPVVDVVGLTVAGTTGWVNKDATKVEAINFSAASGVSDPMGTADPALGLSVKTTTAGGFYSYKLLGGLNLKKDVATLGLDGQPLDRVVKSLVVAFQSNSPKSTSYTPPQFRIILGKSVGGTSSPADAAYAFDPTLAYSWDIKGDDLLTEPLVELPLDSVPEAVLLQADYLLIMCVEPPSGLGLTTPSLHYSRWTISSFHGLGPILDGKTWMRSQFRSPQTDLRGEASLPVPMTIVAPEVSFRKETATSLLGGSVNVTRRFWQTPKTFAKVTVTIKDTDPDEVSLYRAVTEPVASLSQDGLGLNYHTVQVIPKPVFVGASVNVVFYDNLYDAQLRATPTLDPRAQSTGIPQDPPRYVAASHQRLAIACSNAHPYRVWLADIINELSFPNEPFEASKEVGRGGYIDVENQEAITGITTLRDDFVIFTTDSVYALKVKFEATGDERWELIKLVATAGMVSPQGYTHFPGGLIWASHAGLFYILDTVPQVDPQSLSRDIQRSWEAIPEDLRSEVSVKYHPQQEILLVATSDNTSAFHTNHLIYPLDFRRKSPSGGLGAWAGEWSSTHPVLTSLTYLRPKLLFIDQDRAGVWQTYILRTDRGTIDRWLVPGLDTDPYKDYLSSIQWKAETGWVNPEIGGVFRPCHRRIRLTHDLTTNAINGKLDFRIDVRPPLKTKTFTQNFDIPGNQTQNGVILFGGSRKGNAFPVNLRGNSMKIALKGLIATDVEIRLDGITLDLIYLGEAKREPQGAYVVPPAAQINQGPPLLLDGELEEDPPPVPPAPDPDPTPPPDPLPPSTGAVPNGIIAFWDSEVGPLPDGWILCDGTDDTPDLVTDDPFITVSGTAGRTVGVAFDHETQMWAGGETFLTNGVARRHASLGPGVFIGSVGCMENLSATLQKKIINVDASYYYSTEYGQVNPHSHGPLDATFSYPAGMMNVTCARQNFVPVISRNAEVFPEDIIGLFNGPTPGGWVEDPATVTRRSVDVLTFLQGKADSSGWVDHSDTTSTVPITTPTVSHLDTHVYYPYTGVNSRRGWSGLIHNHVLDMTGVVYGASLPFNAPQASFALGRSTADNAVPPVGGIFLWSGLLGDIPEGFQVCDGTNLTPNLIDKERFIEISGYYSNYDVYANTERVVLVADAERVYQDPTSSMFLDPESSLPANSPALGPGGTDGYYSTTLDPYVVVLPAAGTIGPSDFDTTADLYHYHREHRTDYLPDGTLVANSHRYSLIPITKSL